MTHHVSENVRGLVSQIRDSGPLDGGVNLVYAYDADGNPLTITDNATHARTTTASYDGLDRLTSAAIAGVAGGATTHYKFDALDRIAQVAQGTNLRNYAYGNYYAGQLTAVTDSATGATSTYGYDAQGNLASRNGVPYQFDYGNRLRAVGGLEGGYLYDGHGRRVAQTDATGTIDSFYDHAGQLVFQRDRDGGTHDYLYLGGKLVAIRDYDTQGIARVMRYQHTDARGSIIRQTGANGMQYPDAFEGPVYDAWGLQVAGLQQDGPSYTGHVHDLDTGLLYMQQRYYDPAVGRFLSVDPVGVNTTTGANLDRYDYANDNPLRFTDPDGRCTGSLFCGTDKGAAYYSMGAAAGEQAIRGALAKYSSVINYGHVDITGDVYKAKKMGSRHDYLGFYHNVRTGGDWDYKDLPKFGDYKDKPLLAEFGNFAFGMLAHAFGFTEGESIGGAGYYQTFHQGHTQGNRLTGDLDYWGSAVMMLLPQNAFLYDRFDSIAEFEARIGVRFGDYPEDTFAIINGYDYYGARYDR